MDLFSYLLGARNSGGGGKIQYDVIPTPDETIVGKIIQYVGETDETYTNGYFYIGVSDNEENPTYSWEQLDVQPTNILSNYNNGIIIDNSIDLLGYKKGMYYSKASLFSYSPKAQVGSNYSIGVSSPAILFILKDVTDDLPDNTIIAIAFGMGIDNRFSTHLIKISYSSSNGLLAQNRTDTRQLMTIADTQTVSGLKTFSTIPQQSNTDAPTQDTEFTNKKYVDDNYLEVLSSIASIISNDKTPKRWTQDSDLNNRIDFDIWDTGFYIPNNIGQSSVNSNPENPSGGGAILGDMLFINYFKDIQELRENPTTNATMFAYGIILNTYDTDASFNIVTFSWTGRSTQLITITKVNFNSGHVMSFISEHTQTIKGVKTFNSIPKITANLSPTNNLELVNKQYVDNLITSYSGYDATKTQVLKNVNGTLTWVDE